MRVSEKKPESRATSATSRRAWCACCWRPSSRTWRARKARGTTIGTTMRKGNDRREEVRPAPPAARGVREGRRAMTPEPWRSSRGDGCPGWCPRRCRTGHQRAAACSRRKKNPPGKSATYRGAMVRRCGIGSERLWHRRLERPVSECGRLRCGIGSERLWHRRLERPVSECGTLRHGMEPTGGAITAGRVLELATLCAFAFF